MSVINTNISAIAAQNSLRTSGLGQSTAMERLSTGVRINSAKDDAAGLAISTRMTANIRGISAAIRNANDGISLTQTAEGSLSAIGDNLQRIRELAVQSANTGNNSSDRAALNAEAAQLIQEIDRVASNSAFNGIKLLDGSFKDQSLQVGAGNASNDRINLSIGSAKANALGYSKSLTTGSAVPTTTLAKGDLSINGTQVGETTADGVSYSSSSASGFAKALAINAISDITGVKATVGATQVTGIVATTPTATLAAGAVRINGVDIGAIEASTTAVDRGTQVSAAINSKSSETGVTATSDNTGAVSLQALDGRNITVSATAAGYTGTGLGVSSFHTKSEVSTTEAANIGFTALSAGGTVTVAGLTFTAGSTALSAEKVAAAFANIRDGSAAASLTSSDGTYSGTFTGYSTGTASTTFVVAVSSTPSTDITDLTATGSMATAATVTVTNTTTANTFTFSAGLDKGGIITLGGMTFTASKATTATDLAKVFSNLKAGDNVTKITSEFGKFTGTNTGLNSYASSGSAVTFISNSASAASLAFTAPTSNWLTDYTSKITLSTSQSTGITLGGAKGLLSTGQTAGFTASDSNSVASVNISTAEGAKSALTTLDAAINNITDSRAAMGAYQNRLTASIANLETTSMNLQASRSRILDTDYAKETTNLAKSQIVQQAATAMLAQANQSAQSVLALLK
jgi:flagellin